MRTLRAPGLCKSQVHLPVTGEFRDESRNTERQERTEVTHRAALLSRSRFTGTAESELRTDTGSGCGRIPLTSFDLLTHRLDRGVGARTPVIAEKTEGLGLLAALGENACETGESPAAAAAIQRHAKRAFGSAEVTEAVVVVLTDRLMGLGKMRRERYCHLVALQRAKTARVSVRACDTQQVTAETPELRRLRIATRRFYGSVEETIRDTAVVRPLFADRVNEIGFGHGIRPVFWSSKPVSPMRSCNSHVRFVRIG